MTPMLPDLLDTLNDISRCLATLALQAKAEALAGLGSRSKILEHTLLPVLRRVYGAPGLTNTNALAANFPGIDLYDPVSRLGVQVTSESTAEKIAKTIEATAGLDLSVDHLVVILVAETNPRRQARTHASWKAATGGRFAFDPVQDVLAFDQLLGRIQQLPEIEVREIAQALRSLVDGTHALHLLPHLRQQVERQLADEERTARYIPDVFVETHSTKYQARCFSHPTLFLQRVQEWFSREPFAALNRLAVLSGLPEVVGPGVDPAEVTATPEAAGAAATVLLQDLASIEATLGAYAEINRDGGAGVPRDQGRAYVLSETRYYIEMVAGSRQYRLRDRRAELECVRARVFLLTGPAGQGKTNFLCDFAARFLLRHEVPCAYVTARQLSRLPHPDLSAALCSLIFPSAVASLDDGLGALRPVCEDRGQPFVLLIDGLNEHPDIRTFSGQLEHFLEQVVQRHKHVRLLMTCRSEFLHQRFGSMLTGPVSPVLYLSEAHGHRINDDQYRELVARYFRFFRVRPSLVSRRVIEFLQRDVLLLRFFCEAYGARDRDDDYRQPFVGGIYRDEIFRQYITEKMGRAQKAVAEDRATSRPLARDPGIRRVLSLVAEHMLRTGRYADVPRSVIPSELDAELTALLDEELVLRHDLGSAPSLLAEAPEVLNFTFDEMRDFFLAQHLIAIHAKDPV